jgi:hypothetical protein
MRFPPALSMSWIMIIGLSGGGAEVSFAMVQCAVKKYRVESLVGCSDLFRQKI